MNTSLTPNAQPSSTKPVAPIRNRFNPLGWSRPKQVTAAVVVASLALGGWAAFRPERLFINNTVNEKFSLTASNGSAPQLLGQGNFKSLGHHAAGNASIYKQNGRHILRLADGFATSNGPDVRVYLVEGSDGADNAVIKSGKIIDLGVIKGNIGDQNYTLPANFDPAKFRSVSIWCKRFAVNFAAASLALPTGETQTASASPAVAQPVAMKAEASTKPIVVTTGAFKQTTHATKGQATITEDGDGNRTLTLKGFKTSDGPKLRVYLYGAESVESNASAKKLVQGKKFVDLGALKTSSGTQSYAVPKNIDLWEFLAVGIWCDKFDVQFGAASLAAPGA